MGIEDQLPIADRNSELEEASIRAFIQVLPLDTFVFRSESRPDAGVDGTLELKTNGRFTNFRSHVQLKATDSPITNRDGSISVQVAVSSFNYLLNGQVPLYVLFIEPRNELRWVWADDEGRRLNESNPGWKSQQTVTIRFQRLIDDNSLRDIRARILATHRMQGEILKILESASNLENPTISIDRDTFEITDPERAKEILLTSGRLLISNGYVDEFKRLTRLLDNHTERLPNILLSRAYAEYHLGNYQIANALLSQAVIVQNDLNEDDKQFLQFLRKSCEWLLGDCSFEQYVEYLNSNAERVTGNFAISYELSRARFTILAITDPYGRDEAIKELRTLVEATLTMKDISPPLKLFAKSIWLEVEGTDISSGLLREVAGDQMRVQQGFPSRLSNITEEFSHRHLKFIVDLEQALKEAKDMGHRPLIAMLTQVSALVSFMFLTNNHSISLILRADTDHPTYKELQGEIFKKGIRLTDEASKLYQELGDVEGELRAKIVQADYYEFVGERGRAAEIATKVLPVAEALGYVRQVEGAKLLIAGEGLRARIDSSIRDTGEIENDIRRLEMTDEELRLYASQFMKIMDIPADREEIVARNYLSIRIISRERLDWCRHLDVLENLDHRKSRATYFRTDPTCIAICRKLGYQSTLGSQDREMVIRAFKVTHCNSCPERSPVSEDERDAIRRA